MDELEECCLFPSVWRVPSYFSVINFQFDCAVVGEHVLYDFGSFKFLEVCFLAQDLGVSFIGTWKECVFCYFVVDGSVNVFWILLADV